MGPPQPLRPAAALEEVGEPTSGSDTRPLYISEYYFPLYFSEHVNLIPLTRLDTAVWVPDARTRKATAADGVSCEGDG